MYWSLDRVRGAHLVLEKVIDSASVLTVIVLTFPPANEPCRVYREY